MRCGALRLEDFDTGGRISADGPDHLIPTWNTRRKKRQTRRELFLQRWDKELHKAESVRLFVGLRHSDPLPDEGAILNFRHLLERHELGKDLFDWEQDQGGRIFSRN